MPRDGWTGGKTYDQWVDLLGGLGGLLLGVQDSLDLVGLDETSKIWEGDGWAGQVVSGLGGGVGRLGAEEGIQLLEGSLGPDDQTTEVTSGSEGEEIELVDVGEGDTRQVAEGAANTVVLVVDDKGSLALDVAAVAELADSRADLARVLALLDVLVQAELLEEADGILGLLEGLDTIVNDDWDLRNVRNLVSTSLDEGWEGRSGDGAGGSVTLLVDVDLLVPSAPDLGWGEHASLAAHVS